jgi:hypothetical protein
MTRTPRIASGNKGAQSNSFQKLNSIHRSSFFLLVLVALGSCITLTGCGGLVSNSNTGSNLSGLSCTNSSITGAATDSCTVTLTAAATAATTINVSSNNASVTVPATVTVAFGATTGTFTATAGAVTSAETVTLTSTANGVSQSFLLKLNPETATAPPPPASTPTLTINSSSVSFGNVAVGVPSTQTLTLNSTGTAAVTVSSATISGSGFTDSGVTFPLTLNPGQTATLNLQFEPAATGADSGQLTVASNSSSNASAVIPLSGTGIPLQIGLNWDAPTGSSATVSGYNIYRATGSSSTYTKLNSSLNSPTSYTDGSVSANTTYEYYVTSVDSTGVESSPSNTASVAVP